MNESEWDENQFSWKWQRFTWIWRNFLAMSSDGICAIAVHKIHLLIHSSLCLMSRPDTPLKQKSDVIKLATQSVGGISICFLCVWERSLARWPSCLLRVPSLIYFPVVACVDIDTCFRSRAWIKTRSEYRITHKNSFYRGSTFIRGTTQKNCLLNVFCHFAFEPTVQWKLQNQLKAIKSWTETKVDVIEKSRYRTSNCLNNIGWEWPECFQSIAEGKFKYFLHLV